MAARATTCPYCGVGCGVIAGGGGVRPDATHPSSLGRICAKGATLGDTLDDRDRLRQATVRGVPVGLDAALDRVADRFRRAIGEHGPGSVAFYLSGQLLTEDYYVANKLMKGFVGSANIDTNSRLCMASTVTGHKRAFGADLVPAVYDDIDEADLLVLVGSNSAHCHPVLHGRALGARAKRGTRIVAIDPRRTETARTADLHLAVRPDGDVALFTGLLAHLERAGALDRAWAGRYAAGLDEALLATGSPTIEVVAEATGIGADAVRLFFDWFAATDRTLTLFSQGVNQSVRGTDKVNAILNVHLATGRIGRPGSGPLSLTGQPNAMGGREVGGLATTLAAHMDFADADRDRVGRFWNATRVAAAPGLTAVDLFEAAADGRIRALWIAGTNPAVSMPRAAGVRDALRRCPFVAVSDCWSTDTAALADTVLPAAGWGEKDGTVTNSERRISRQRPFRAAPGDATADWRLFAALGRRLGFADAFDWAGPSAVFAEWAALTAFENDDTAGGRRRVLDLGGLAGMGRAEYDALRPVRWPVPASGYEGGTEGGEGGRLFAAGGFATPDGRARIVPVRPDPPPAALASDLFRLNTGRVRDQWHTMTRTGLVPRLMEADPVPTLALVPTDLALLGLREGDPVEVASPDGAFVLPAAADPGLAPGEVFAPMHWSDRFWSGGVVGAAVQAARDSVSHQPALKGTAVRLTPLVAHWHGLLLVAPASTGPGVGDGIAVAALAREAGCLAARVPLDGDRVLFHLLGLDPLAPGEGWRTPLDVAAPDRPDRPVRQVVRPGPGGRFLRALAFGNGGRALAVLAVAADRDALPRPEALAASLDAPEAPDGALLAGAGLHRPETIGR